MQFICTSLSGSTRPCNARWLINIWNKVWKLNVLANLCFICGVAFGLGFFTSRRPNPNNQKNDLFFFSTLRIVYSLSTSEEGHSICQEILWNAWITFFSSWFLHGVFQTKSCTITKSGGGGGTPSVDILIDAFYWGQTFGPALLCIRYCGDPHQSRKEDWKQLYLLWCWDAGRAWVLLQSSPYISFGTPSLGESF